MLWDLEKFRVFTQVLALREIPISLPLYRLWDLEKFQVFHKALGLRKFRALLLPKTQAAGEPHSEVKTWSLFFGLANKLRYVENMEEYVGIWRFQNLVNDICNPIENGLLKIRFYVPERKVRNFFIFFHIFGFLIPRKLKNMQMEDFDKSVNTVMN